MRGRERRRSPAKSLNSSKVSSSSALISLSLRSKAKLLRNIWGRCRSLSSFKLLGCRFLTERTEALCFSKLSSFSSALRPPPSARFSKRNFSTLRRRTPPLRNDWMMKNNEHADGPTLGWEVTMYPSCCFVRRSSKNFCSRKDAETERSAQSFTSRLSPTCISSRTAELGSSAFVVSATFLKKGVELTWGEEGRGRGTELRSTTSEVFNLDGTVFKGSRRRKALM
mmetsp:Transcript_1074/g.2239  ORF Transcript_1074/g.2239 Transcript_1074/m.2239 type:complete len:225 (+) Transcript_1074:671-1345(+)